MQSFYAQDNLPKSGKSKPNIQCRRCYVCPKNVIAKWCREIADGENGGECDRKGDAKPNSGFAIEWKEHLFETGVGLTGWHKKVEFLEDVRLCVVAISSN